jgi:hypothetical protein
MTPFQLIRRFAGELGWRGIEQTDITLTSDICGDLPCGTVMTCFSTTDIDFFIQINQATAGIFGKYKVSVVAERYGIRPMEFQTCRIGSIDDAVKEAKRLNPLFARRNFRDPTWRRAYLTLHPEKFWRGRKKWRGWKAALDTRCKRR